MFKTEVVRFEILQQGFFHWLQFRFAEYYRFIQTADGTNLKSYEASNIKPGLSEILSLDADSRERSADYQNK